jgi:8-oxo-dGTP pyrophosphatase MutT (NUDIX family)
MKLDKLRQERTHILIESKLQSENIDCLYSPITIAFQDSERSYIEKEWDREVKGKPIIFDGTLVHVMRQDFSQSNLVFDTCMSSFKEWIGTKSNEFEKIFGRNRVIKPLSVGSMIVTADNKWIIGRRSKTYDFERQYTLLGGYLDPEKDIVNSKPNPFHAIRREIEEETGIDKKHDIGSVICLGLDGIDQPYLAFNTQLKISYDELVYGTPKEKEFRTLDGYENEKRSLENFVTTNYKELTPHTLANILMSHKVLNNNMDNKK